MLNLEDSVTKVKYVGEEYGKRFSKLGIFTVYDLLTIKPTRYIDHSKPVLLEDIKDSDYYTFIGTVKNIKQSGNRYKPMYIVTVADRNNSIAILKFYNQKYTFSTLRINHEYVFYGKSDVDTGVNTYFNSPEFEENTGSLKYLIGLRPIYPLTEGISQKWLRSRILYCMGETKFTDDGLTILKTRLISFSDAVKYLHTPRTLNDVTLAIEKFKFDEILNILLARKAILEEMNKRKAVTVTKNIQNIKLDFTLSESQSRSINEIYEDLKKNIPMNRILIGDVGSGKSIVAFLSVIAMYLSGYSSIIFAPTSILAEQHYNSIIRLFSDNGLDENNILLLTSKTRINKKEIDFTTPKVYIGTHALLFNMGSDIERKVGLIVIDEQQRLGVEQRYDICENEYKYSGIYPHTLIMTATPIPRSLSLTILNDLSSSYLEKLPDRQPILTRIVNDEKINDMYEFIRKKITKSNEQAYFIYPVIDIENKLELKSVLNEYESLKEIYKEFNVGLLHGKLKEKEKLEIFNKFKNNEIQILVSTSVVEVGVDSKYATIIVIENADRFGLASLHQLRGRVGRNNRNSYCFLPISKIGLYNKSKQFNRLHMFTKENDGYKLAEYDMKTRGIGEIIGQKQSGDINLKYADLTEQHLINMANEIYLEKFNTNKHKYGKIVLN